MNYRRGLTFALPVAVLAAAALWAWRPAGAQSAAKAPTGKITCIGCSVDGKTTPRTPDGHPDLSGFWGGTSGGASGLGNNLAGRSADGSVLFDFGGADLNAQGQNKSAIAAGDNNPGWSIGSSKPEDNPVYKPEYDKKMRAIAANDFGAANRDDPVYNCTPSGVPRGAFGGAMQIVQTPTQIAIFFENLLNNRLVYLDGRGHPDPEDFDTFQMGHSIGYWDGDTLVVDTAGLSDDTWLAGSFGAPKFAIIHSDKEHVIERWTRVGDTLTWQATVEDPVMFEKPWAMRPRRVQHATAKDTDFLQPTACRITEPEHISVPTKDDFFYCNYCVKPKDAKPNN
jgi:hypothetical protein